MLQKKFNRILTKVDEFTSHQRLEIIDAINHSGDYKQLIDFFEKSFARNPHCPHCGKTLVIRCGSKSGLLRYKCKSCNKTFNSLTNTPFARLRKKELWISYLKTMLDSHSLRKAATRLNIDKNTAFKWRHRFLASAHKDKPAVMSGLVEVDETYFRKSKKGSRHLGRPPRKRGGPAPQRGLSKEHVCVVVTCDRSGHEANYISGLGPVNGKWLDLILSKHISKDSLLITDSVSAYDFFCSHQAISHVRVKSNDRIRGPYHIQNVNAYHRVMKKWFRRFNGVATKYLDHYLGWCHELHNRHLDNPWNLLELLFGLKTYLIQT